MQYFGVGDMDKKIIEKYFNYENGFYLEIGGNDGITQSNTAHLELFKGWTGMLVEPIYYKYRLMKDFIKKSICVNACVSDKDGEIVKFNDVNLMSFVENSRKSEEAHHLFTDLPILFIDDWDKVTYDFLNEKYEEMTNKEWSYDKLKMSYWEIFIKEEISKIK